MQAESSPSNPEHNNDAGTSLFDLLQCEYDKLQNYQGKGFICIEAAKRVFTYDRVASFCLEHRVCSHQELTRRSERVERILTRCYLLLSVLIFAKLEYLAPKLVSQGFSDTVLFDEVYFERKCADAGLHAEEREKLVEHRRRVGVIFGYTAHQDLPRGTTLPFTKRENLGNYGSFGAVYRVTVAKGHLQGYNKTVVADKRVRAINKYSEGEWNRMYREVETLQRRRHPNIIPMLASYFLEMFESGEYVKELHLLFPWADIDLANWMTSAHIPEPVSKLKERERQEYLYHSIYALTSGLSYMHRMIDGTVTAHHDLKPKNVLIVNGVFKIGDFGHSHLRSAIEGSETDGGGRGLGTYEYQPPEYWEDDGTRADRRHGRAFDAYALGCIIVELVTLIVYGWELEKVSEFRNERRKNTPKHRPTPVSVPEGADASFHNNPAVVRAWIEQLKRYDESQVLRETLDVALGLMITPSSHRVYTWEAEMSLFDISNSNSSRISKLNCEPPRAQAPSTEVSHRFQNPMHRAVESENITRITSLWELGWLPSVENPNGETALELMDRSSNSSVRELVDKARMLLEAARIGDLETLKDLLDSGLSPLLVEGNQYTALHEAIENRHMNVVYRLLETRAKDQLSIRTATIRELPVHQVAKSGDITLMERILPDSPYINSREVYAFGRSPLYLAAMCGHKEMAEFLVNHGSWILIGPVGLRETAVHRAARYSTDEMLTIVLRAKHARDSLEVKDLEHRTPIMVALEHDSAACFETLRQHGASLDVKIPNENTPLHIIAERGLHHLLRKHMHYFQADHFNALNTAGETPIMLSNDAGHKEVSKLLKARLYELHGPAPLILGFIDPAWKEWVRIWVPFWPLIVMALPGLVPLFGIVYLLYLYFQR